MLALLVGCGDSEPNAAEDRVADGAPEARAPQQDGALQDGELRDDADLGGADAGTSERADAASEPAAPAVITMDAAASEADARVLAIDAATDARTLEADGDVSFDASSDAASTDAADVLQEAGTAPSPKLPSKTGTCPAFSSGDVDFSPAGIAARKVRLWVGANGGGPLVIYWHSTGNQPVEAENSALAGVLGQITAVGGVVAAPYTGANDGTFPWLSASDEALKVADEVVACAIEKKSIDSRRIHVIGFSAGGLMTSTMSLSRSSYVASVVPYSGGLQSSASFQDASNKFPALIFYGGSSDTFLINFQTTSKSYSSTLRANGNYTAMCNHGGGHAIPSEGPAAAWRFFQDHPFGTNPSPYVASGFPDGVPSYCVTSP